jgi:uncharacterized DUF497 family protein
MAEEDFGRLLANVRDYDWNPSKREQIFRKRHIAFEDARIVFQGPITVLRSDRKGENRYLVFGLLEDVEVAFVCTFRGDICWIITARRARRDERKKYYAHLSQRPAQDQE